MRCVPPGAKRQRVWACRWSPELINGRRMTQAEEGHRPRGQTAAGIQGVVRNRHLTLRALNKFERWVVGFPCGNNNRQGR